MAVKYVFTTQLSDGWDGTYANDAVRAIYQAYIGDGRITQPVDIVETGDGRHENTMTFRDRAAYDAWYAEIDAIDTSPPVGMSYVGSGTLVES